MKSLGKPLLRGSQFLSKYWKRAPEAIGKHAMSLVLYDEGWTREKLEQDLQAEFCLEPLSVGKLVSVLAYTDPQEVRSAGRSEICYVAEARVTYSGTPMLWPARPTADLNFPFHGVVAKASAAWRAYVPSMDLSDFRREAEEVLWRTQAALHAYEPTVRNYDALIRQHINLVARTL